MEDFQFGRAMETQNVRVTKCKFCGLGSFAVYVKHGQQNPFFMMKLVGDRGSLSPRKFSLESSGQCNVCNIPLWGIPNIFKL